ncbi:PX domain-containing protein 1 isoform X2 [Stigmatopora nigra]
MASAVFEGTSLVNMFVRDCWVNGVRRLVISPRGDEEDFFEIRTEWSDRNVLYLHRSYSDLGRLFRRLADSFPEDGGHLSASPLMQGLLKIKDAMDIEEKLNEVERLLKNAINMPCKYSRSEVMLTFFERSPLDQVLRNDKRSCAPTASAWPTRKPSCSTRMRKRDPLLPTPRSPRTTTDWISRPCRRTRRRRPTSPTCPTTTWSPSRRTSWNDGHG